MSDKKEKVLRFDMYDNEVNYCEDGELYDIEDVHDAIKKSIDNDCVVDIVNDLVAYFGLDLG